MEIEHYTDESIEQVIKKIEYIEKEVKRTMLASEKKRKKRR